MNLDHATRRIGQAHLAPGMSDRRLADILARHNVTDGWAGVSRATVETIINEIAAIVRAAKEQRQ